jgi:capsular polysaccharide transport system permease protein
MSELAEICEKAVGNADTGLLEACRLSAVRRRLSAPELPAFYARLSEALLHNGRREDAVACARIAIELPPTEEEIANICAWVFSNCERHEEAVAAYERLLQIRGDWAEGHRHASGCSAAAGQWERAISHARRASDLQTDCFEFAFHAACILAADGRYEEAVAYFGRATAIEPGHGPAMRGLSGAKFALGQCDEAVALALSALALAPDDRLNALHATELLLRSGRFEVAADIILAAVTAHPQDHVALRLLSATQMLRDQMGEGLDAIDRALAARPEIAEYHVHRGHLLLRLGRLQAAADAFDHAAALDPSNLDAKRAQLTAYFDGGRFTEALAIGGELIRTSPENEEYAQALLQVLNRRLEVLDGEYVVLAERALREPRQIWARPTLWEALCTQGRVIYALIIRETRTRFGDSRLGYGWALLEPAMHILMLSLVFAVMMRGRPPIGEHFFLFYYTGIIPYHLFVHTSSSMTFAITSNGSLLQLPLVSTFDVLMARGLLELLTDILVAVILLTIFGAMGIGALPRDFLGIGAAVLVVWLLGLGFGFFNAVVTAFAKSWDKIWAQCTRLLYFCSGIFYVPGMMPDWIRDILAWNPLLHAVDWFRASFFQEYEPHWLDRTYLSTAAVIAVLAGLGLERGLRRQLCEPL